jgi:hypothetical protein
VSAPARLKDIPVLASDGSNVKQFADAVREALQTFRGTRGDKLDTALTLRALSSGLNLSNFGIGGAPPYGSGTDGPGGVPGTGPYHPDLTPPPTPEGLAVSAGISQIYVEHDTPVYLQGHGHDRTIVYGAKWTDPAPEPSFSDAVPIFDFQGTFGAYPTDPATRWCIWIKWRSIDGVQSTSPAGGAHGAQATTGQDVALLLEALTGEISESQLFADLGARIDLIDGAGPGSVDARIASEATIRQGDDDALADAITTVSAQVGVNTAAIATETTARVTADGTLFAQFTVKIDVNGYVSGFGLASTAAGAAPSSAFLVRADSFAVASPSGPGIAPIVPFIVRTTPGTVNGVPYPAGVYMDAAYILDLTAAIARLGTAWIDDAKVANLSAAKLTAGTGVIGGNLMSSNYVGGSTGWLVQPGGFAEFSNIQIRGATYTGTIFANAGTIGGITIGLHDIRSSNYVPGTAGFRLNDDGSGEFYNITARGNITANSLNFANGTFTGTLAGVNGTYSGVLTAAAINAVNTINLAGNALTVLISAQRAGVARSTTNTTDKTTTYDIGSITTDANGKGWVTLQLSPDGWSSVLAWQFYSFILMEASIAGAGVPASITFKITRTIGASTVDLRTQSASGVVGGGDTFTRFCSFGMVVDHPGAGVTATYRLVAITHNDTANPMAHEVIPFTYSLNESKQ